MNKNFGGIIWTNHALQRLKERKISQSDAWVTWRRPQESKHASIKGAWIFYRTYENTRIEVVAKQNEKKEWVILSVWSKYINKKPNNESFLSFLIKKVFSKEERKRK